MSTRTGRAAAFLALFAPLAAFAQTSTCARCEEWKAPQEPFRIFGNTYYVGTHGISSLLIASPQGHILIDGMIEAAPQIAEHIRQLGFRIEDVKVIGNTHAHYDHAGSLAEFERLSGAQVVASPWSAEVLTKTSISKEDPQYGVLVAIPLVSKVRVLRDGESVRTGDLAVTAHFTPGHTPGGTTWTWQSCEQDRCLSLVYADSLTAVSADGYRYSDHPALVDGFGKSFAFLREVSCDILVTAHPELSGLWTRLNRRSEGEADALVNPGACKDLADRSEADLRRRLATEQKP